MMTSSAALPERNAEVKEDVEYGHLSPHSCSSGPFPCIHEQNDLSTMNPADSGPVSKVRNCWLRRMFFVSTTTSTTPVPPAPFLPLKALRPCFRMMLLLCPPPQWSLYLTHPGGPRSFSCSSLFLLPPRFRQ
ncbi:hypothetical protein INR49_008967 [Caranx melampygus]|nr:hypothetical protein INR49_008967 [Caranx melampygus]